MRDDWRSKKKSVVEERRRKKAIREYFGEGINLANLAKARRKTERRQRAVARALYRKQNSLQEDEE